MELPAALAVAQQLELELVALAQLESVRDGHHRGALRDDRLVQRPLFVRVDGGRRLVQDGEGRRVVKQTRETDSLALAPGEHVVPLEVPRVQTDAGNSSVHELPQTSEAKAPLHALVLLLRGGGRNSVVRAPSRRTREGARAGAARRAALALDARGVALGERDVGVHHLVTQRALQQVRALREPHHGLP